MGGHLKKRKVNKMKTKTLSEILTESADKAEKIEEVRKKNKATKIELAKRLAAVFAEVEIPRTYNANGFTVVKITEPYSQWDNGWITANKTGYALDYGSHRVTDTCPQTVWDGNNLHGRISTHIGSYGDVCAAIRALPDLLADFDKMAKEQAKALEVSAVEVTA